MAILIAIFFFFLDTDCHNILLSRLLLLFKSLSYFLIEVVAPFQQVTDSALYIVFKTLKHLTYIFFAATVEFVSRAAKTVFLEFYHI